MFLWRNKRNNNFGLKKKGGGGGILLRAVIYSEKSYSKADNTVSNQTETPI